MTELIYLAVPYTHADPAVEDYRYRTVTKVATELMKKGRVVFSPITQAVPLKQAGELPTKWEYWKTFDTVFLERCDRLMVLTLDGWKESVGVTEEIQIATRLGLPIEYIDLNTFYSQTPERSTP